MGMGVISDEDLAKELANLNPDRPNRKLPEDGVKKDGPIVEIMPVQGRKEHDVNVPDSVRKLIGATSLNEGRREAIELGNMFGVSPSSVSAYSKGSTSTASYNSPKKSILDHINNTKDRITKKAHNRLKLTLDAITPDKLTDVKARDLAGIAKDMSVVIKNMEPENKNTEDKNKPVFVFYKPEMHQENHYERMKVEE